MTPQHQLFNLITGYWATQLIYVAAILGLADWLKDGEQTVDFLAEQTRTSPKRLYSVLRALAGYGIFEETVPQTFRLTPLADCLRSDFPNTLRYRAIISGEKDWRAWGALLDGIKNDDVVPFEKMHGGAPHFDYLLRHPDEAAAFNQTMTQFAGQNYPAVVDAYAFEPHKTIVDVGGGHGRLLAMILEKNPDLKGTLFDLPQVIEEARNAPQTMNFQYEVGNFFDYVPPKRDYYVLAHIIHDWDDEQSIRILSNIREAMHPESNVLLIEKIIPEGNDFHLSKLMDVHMLVLSGAQERTADEYRTLLAKAGLQLRRIISTASIMNVIEAVRT